MSLLTDAIFTEKYRPRIFEDLIFEKKEELLNLLKNNISIPSMIFYSSKPGTGKTSTAKIIIHYLKCDSLLLNSSNERGIDTIRDKIQLFSMTMSSDNNKKCIFLDEADGLTSQAQDCLRNLMETYSNNCFFIFSCNDISKIIEPIRSRCLTFNFEKPSQDSIITRLFEICKKENIEIDSEKIVNVVANFYPDIRSMIQSLQLKDIETVDYEKKYNYLLNKIISKDIAYLYNEIYSGEVNCTTFNKWLFNWLFKNIKAIGLERGSRISMLLAENEKCFVQGVNIEIVFLANMLEIMKLL